MRLCKHNKRLEDCDGPRFVSTHFHYAFLVADPLRTDADEAWMRAHIAEHGDPGWAWVPRQEELK